MKFVVTGATGFIGQEVITTLLKSGHYVYCVCRPDSPKVALLPSSTHLSVIFATMSDYSTLSSMIPSADVMINLAWDGITREGRDFTDVQRENISYAMQAMNSAKTIGCRVFVETGSQAEYGVTEGRIYENTLCCPFSDYGKAKLALKEVASKHAGEICMKYLHLRIFSVYGENDHPWAMISSCTSKLLNNEDVELSACQQLWNYLYVKDCAKQIVLLSEWAYNEMNTTCEVFNLASEDTRMLKSYIEEMRVMTNSKSNLLFGRVIPKHIVSLNPDISKLKRTIGFVSDYSFSLGYQNVINKYKNG